MDNLTDKQKAALGLALIIVPGAAITFGAYLLYKEIRKTLAKKEKENGK